MSHRIQAVIVDDERLAREGVRLRLERQPDVDIVAEASSADQAAEVLRGRRPDVVFLDIEMPGANGFAAIPRLEEAGDALPLIICVTAHDRYAIEAFRRQVFDYLLKPFDDARFDEVMARIRGQLDLVRVHAALGDRVAPPHAYRERVIVRSGSRATVVRSVDIDWIAAEGDYARIHAHGRTHLVRLSLSALGRQLDPSRFVRVHRAAVVNIDRIRELEPYARGDYVLVLQDGTRLRVSRRYRAALAATLGGGL